MTGKRTVKGRTVMGEVRGIPWYSFLEPPRGSEPEGRGTLPFPLTFQTKLKRAFASRAQ